MKIDLNKIKKEKPIGDLINFSFINLDKPAGPTSFQVSQYIKESFELNKTSHLGTLDPQVTGVLPIALGRACRLNDYFMHRDKTYVGIMRLHDGISDTILNEKIKNFIGKITQLPPVRSRVKREERVREVKSFNVIEREGKDVVFSTNVQAGTYIRKLIHDLGEEIGGAHMLELRRIQAGNFFEKDSITIYEFDKAIESYKRGETELLHSILIPAEAVSEVLPTLFIKKEAMKKCLTGSPIFSDSIEKSSVVGVGDALAVFFKNQFIGCYRVKNEGKVVAIPEFVFN